MHSFLTASLAVLLIQAASVVQAQLQSCTDLGVALMGPICYCTVNETSLDAIGVSNFTTELSADPLAWMVGHMPFPSTGDLKTPPDTRVFYLKQPPLVDLRYDTSVKACALIFNGVASKLKFNYSETVEQASVSRGTCEDALTAQCVSDWTQQAHDIASQTDESHLSCEKLGHDLRSKPPSSCHIVKKSWGDVFATELNGSGLPPPVTPNIGCDMTAYQNYSLTEVFRINGTQDYTYRGITPVFTILKPNNAAGNLTTQVNLNCLKPISDATASNSPQGFSSGSAKLQVNAMATWLVTGVLAWQLLV